MSSDPTNRGELTLLSEEEAKLAGVDKEAEDRQLRRHLMLLRRMFQEDANIRECLTAHTKEEKKQGILHFTSTLALTYGGLPLLERAVDFLLTELEQMQAMSHSAYIVDESTGKAIAPFGKDSVYYPPDFIDEAGNLRKGRPILNPGISSALGLANQEAHRKEQALLAAKGHAAHSVEHLREPESIVRTAKEALEKAGVGEPEDDADVESGEIIVGREQHDGVYQASNPNFHRYTMYGELLARKVVQAGHKSCRLGDIRTEGDTKARWFVVRVTVPRAPALVPTLPTP